MTSLCSQVWFLKTYRFNDNKNFNLYTAKT